MNDLLNHRFKSNIRAVFFITNLETVCKLRGSSNEIDKFFLFNEDNSPKRNNLNDFICSIKQIHSLIEDVISTENFKIISSLIDEYSFSILLFCKFEGLFDYFFQTQ